ncbi:MAG: glycosyltransferase family 4 protein [Candidatus Roizmanbacteria bacterium]|nr:glycosyltransferase family 4 protein [Candidatus Roizmanbacteria bacterium]
MRNGERLPIVTEVDHESAAAFYPEPFVTATYPEREAGGKVGGGAEAAGLEPFAYQNYLLAMLREINPAITDPQIDVLLNTTYPTHYPAQIHPAELPFRTHLYELPDGRYEDMLYHYLNDENWLQQQKKELLNGGVWNVHYWVAGGVAAELRRLIQPHGIEVVQTIRYHSQLSDTTAQVDPEYYASNPASTIRLAAERASLQALDVVIMSTAHEQKATAEALEAQGVMTTEEFMAKSAVIPIIVDTDKYKPDSDGTLRRQERKRNFSKYGITDDDEVWAYVGRLDIEKGIMPAVEAFAQWRKDTDGKNGRKPKLVVVGGLADKAGVHRQYDHMMQALRSCPKHIRRDIIITGKPLPHIEIAHAFDLGFYPSLEETFNIAAKKFGAVRTPVLLSDNAVGHTETHPEGTAGFFHITGRYEDYAAAFEMALDPQFRTQFGRNGYKNALQYSPENVTRRLVTELYSRFPEVF